MSNSGNVKIKHTVTLEYTLPLSDYMIDDVEDKTDAEIVEEIKDIALQPEQFLEAVMEEDFEHKVDITLLKM